jgi:radical SAM superfamily enzyme YgiQ (UPF0313 family)
MNTLEQDKMTDLLLLSTPLAGDTLPGGLCPSLSNITLGSYLHSEGVAVSVFDPSTDLEDDRDSDSPKALLERIADTVLSESPKMVGIACLSPIEGRFGAAMARVLKQRNAALPVVLGGVWATACGGEILERCPDIDAIIAGPGEQAALALARGGLQNRGSIPGLIWRDGEQILTNPPAETLPKAPPVDMSLMRHPERYDIFCWLTSRGCPYHCTFCTERLTNPGFTHNPIEKVKADLDFFSDMEKSWYLWICDPLFGVNRKRLTEVCNLLKETPMQFLAETRVDVLHPEDVPQLAAAGCNFIYFGLEAVGHQSLCELEKIDARPKVYERYLEGARNLVEACLKSDILPVFGILQPVPGDTPEDLEVTLNFLQELAAIANRLGDDANRIAPCFHAFPLRFDRGAPYEMMQGHLDEKGVSATADTDPLFDDRFLEIASPSIDEQTAESFREAVRALNPTSDYVRQRLLRSYPRPYVKFDA